MKNKIQYSQLFTIIIVIAITLGIQAYWNIKNYGSNNVALVNLVQRALDEGVENYYVAYDKQNVKRINNKLVSIINNQDSSGNNSKKVPIQYFSTGTASKNSQNIITNAKIHKIVSSSSDKDSVVNGKNSTVKEIVINMETDDYHNTKDQKEIGEAVLKSMLNALVGTGLDLKKMKPYLDSSFKAKGLDFDYGLQYVDSKGNKNVHNIYPENNFELSADAKSSYIADNTKIQLLYPNLANLALKQSLLGVVLSFILFASISIILFYLMKTINNQKQLALMKRDFISNMSHELKTPITVTLSAIEALERFDRDTDKDKTEKYLTISNMQLKKLNLMVDKILETATLETDMLTIRKEEIDLIPFLKNVIDRIRVNTTKTILYKPRTNSLLIFIDPFHIENVINNIIMNAIKYGGNTIITTVRMDEASIEICISDDGNGIPANQRERIFDQFYRIPSENEIANNGFGIGLYYSKKIIQKHEGTIVVVPDSDQTIFKITMP